jgi:MFS superfamily sulfate permease-like transporter
MRKLKLASIAVLILSVVNGGLCIFFDEPIFSLLSGIGIGACVTSLAICRHVTELQEKVDEIKNARDMASKNIAFLSRIETIERPTIH